MKPNTIRQREQLTGWLLALPALLLLLLVFAYPIGRAFWLSLFTRNLGTELQTVFNGLENYARMLGDGRFWSSLTHSTVFTAISISLELAIGTGIALTLNQAFRGRGLVRTVAILPWALPTAVMALAWAWIFNDQYGIVNDLLLRVGLIDQSITWLGDPVRAMLALVVADVWKTTPFIAVILLAGLQAIPEDLYEAHSIDGANPWQNFVKITLPLLAPQMVIAVLFRFAQAFGAFELILVMTGGGPAGATEMVSLYIYDTVMRYLDFGYGAALIVVTFLILIIAVAIASFLISKTRIDVTGER
ncbi:MAG: sugar ABC transporter permease [Cyanobacteria bacterium QH_8_48_120]|jgi:multiple sugar transport system permease protein|nr:MAG: sugar ABC transporter permease [Cyanobacteria bacterium QH_1_48_107]PSO55527.1 MAG: sugar ABC transporter permease [Cyanobacteria bacterium QH_10_48_56]PSO62668.1 MAG: sugar ABC transporter permease [Cyanobacteria bacterium QH_7_48_89]PSO65605.1 MAG: sugar ABC transporter permease [Cyanobacteria bacterium QH_2_48_84]PSO68858.1 MAG: sugar ABC transporter permease [Cyanobacteria bacterium QH_6_48_35]PSO68991.1 MAG: sugar ABC transporter permease [Cyanobacteria bacterium QS_1_48_34]PSO74